jgi:hypothetical protein
VLGTSVSVPSSASTMRAGDDRPRGIRFAQIGGHRVGTGDAEPRQGVGRTAADGHAGAAVGATSQVNGAHEA